MAFIWAVKWFDLFQSNKPIHFSLFACQKCRSDTFDRYKMGFLKFISFIFRLPVDNTTKFEWLKRKWDAIENKIVNIKLFTVFFILSSLLLSIASQPIFVLIVTHYGVFISDGLIFDFVVCIIIGWKWFTNLYIYVLCFHYYRTDISETRWSKIMKKNIHLSRHTPHHFHNETIWLWRRF